MNKYKTLGEELIVAKKKSAKPMLWVSIISMIMFFAGLTSAYIISMEREDWVSIDLPSAFYISTILLFLSSVTLHLSKVYIKKDKRQLSLLFIIVTLFLAVGFLSQQYVGFNQFRNMGLFFTGPESTVSASFIIGITFMHFMHIVAGIIVLFVVIFNHFKYKYRPNNILGFELGSIFWHFLDILWLYLFLFFYFIR